MRTDISIRGIEIGNQIYGYSVTIPVDDQPITYKDLLKVVGDIYANGYWPRFGTILHLINFDHIEVGTLLLKLSADTVIHKEILQIEEIKFFSDGSQWFYFNTLFPLHCAKHRGMMSKEYIGGQSLVEKKPTIYLAYEGDIPIPIRRN